VDFTALAQALDQPEIAKANTALEAYELAGPNMAQWVANSALANCKLILRSGDIKVDCVVIDRSGRILAQS
jgi:cobalt-precorrin-5B (C1)-methyltransferase